MSKKLLLGLILCVGLQAINAADQAQADTGLRAAQEWDEAMKHGADIRTNGLAALDALRRTLQSTYRATAHTLRAGTRYTTETGRNIRNIAQPAIDNPGTTFAAVAAGALALYYLIPRHILKKAAEYTAIGVVTAVTLKAIEHRNTGPAQPRT